MMLSLKSLLKKKKKRAGKNEASGCLERASSVHRASVAEGRSGWQQLLGLGKLNSEAIGAVAVYVPFRGKIMKEVTLVTVSSEAQLPAGLMMSRRLVIKVTSVLLS